ncbi:hydroxycarboxylic acid receptor 2-like isoform X2 [Ruditapes philippinarum]|uniref:hydroxycarboxylic acid receptor 2-like isoform X2 n=1 Tax=Ruditapes philippinarum TaxID=129788 RepID=UPI00295BAF14|nr:hydroxycarboxylic acid receptor 2-like isoform X2 [Ruditapes philippinarum]
MNIFNELKSESLIPAVVILAFLMVVGFVGNLHVLFVYAFRVKPTNHRIYIIFLSIQDITACTILIPLRIYIYNNLWTHSNVFTCKFGSFMMCLILTGSAFTLILVAIDRYRKICNPHGWQIKRPIAKLLCFVVTLCACFCSWPTAALDGEGIVSIDEENKQDKVGRQTKLDNKNLTKCSTGQVVTQTSNESQQKQKRTRRITLAFTLITVFYFISYIPFISLDIFLLHGLFTSTSPTIDVFIAIHIVSSCVFINSTVNCFIYSCFDGRFREEIVMLYKKLCCRHQETV